jgi:type IV pilus assembly protein PilN
MIKINLLPHREEKRKEREKSFYSLLVLGAIAGLLMIVVVGGVIEGLISSQEQRNSVLKKANQDLDEQIKEVSSLQQEIQSLKARQQAVEDLQADRNQPVYLMDELVLQTPEGIYLKSLKQEGQRVVLNGYAQSNERVAEFLRNLNESSPWLDRPDLIEIKSVSLGQGRDAKKIFDFTINVAIRRPRDKDAAVAGKAASAPISKNVAPAVVSKPASASSAASIGSPQPSGAKTAASVSASSGVAPKASAGNAKR